MWQNKNHLPPNFKIFIAAARNDLQLESTQMACAETWLVGRRRRGFEFQMSFKTRENYSKKRRRNLWMSPIYSCDTWNSPPTTQSRMCLIKIIFNCSLKPAKLVTEMQLVWRTRLSPSSLKKKAKQKEELVPGNVTSRAYALKEAISCHRDIRFSTRVLLNLLSFANAIVWCTLSWRISISNWFYLGVGHMKENALEVAH